MNALRSITINFQHYSPGDVEATVVYTDIVGDREEAVYHGRDEEVILKQVTESARPIAEALGSRP